MAYIPFDATEEEIAQKSIVRDGIPTVLEEPLKDWLADTFSDLESYKDGSLGFKIQLDLDIDLGFSARSSISARQFAANAFNEGTSIFMRVIDYVLYSGAWTFPAAGTALEEYLNLYRSKYAVVQRDNRARVGYRVPEGLEETIQEAINAADATAGKLLAEAWEYAFGLEGKAEEAMDKAVKAVERAATPIVCPKHPAPSLGIAANVVKQQGDWVLGLRSNSKAFPSVTLHHMMETLWYGQQYRHVDQHAVSPTIEQARVHVMLAATLVGWFASGQIVRDSGLPQPKNWQNLQP